jgi:hypothetical protein
MGIPWCHPGAEKNIWFKSGLKKTPRVLPRTTSTVAASPLPPPAIVIEILLAILVHAHPTNYIPINMYMSILGLSAALMMLSSPKVKAG